MSARIKSATVIKEQIQKYRVECGPQMQDSGIKLKTCLNSNNHDRKWKQSGQKNSHEL